MSCSPASKAKADTESMSCSPASNAKADDSSLLPGLPDGVVVTDIITRLPWNARPVCRAVSTQWRSCIDASAKRPDIVAKSRQHLLPYFHADLLPCMFEFQVFLTKACKGPDKEWRLAYRRARRQRTYPFCERWRQLPSLKGFLPRPPVGFGLGAISGVVYAWSEGPQSVVLKVDLAEGDWIWKKLPVPYPFSALAVLFNGKIYVPSVWTKGEPASDEEDDMTREVTPWDHDYLRWQCKKMPVTFYRMNGGDLYSFVKHSILSEPKLEIFVYEVCNDSWTTKEMIPIPDQYWSELSDIQLVNGSCFEPASNEGINIIWVDYEDKSFSWFNFCIHNTWIVFDYGADLGAKTLQYIQFCHGRLYGMFIEQKGYKGDDEESKDSCAEYTGDRQDSKLRKRTLMKGKMVLEDEKVHWEEVDDISFYMDAYTYQPILRSTFDQYTLMV